MTLALDSVGGASRYFWTSVDQPWLSVTPASGTVDRQGKVLTVKYSTASLDPGTYNAQITVFAPSASDSPVVVPVTVTVDPDEISSSVVGMRFGTDAKGFCGYQITVPIQMAALGTENAVGLSMTYNKAVFTNPRIALGADADALKAAIVTNMSQAGSGVVGFALALPVGVTFASDSPSEIATVTFTIDPKAIPGPYSFAFTNAPIISQIVGSDAHPVPTKWLTGNVSVLGGYEGSLSPRPTGTNDATFSAEDVVQAGRFVAGVEKPSTAAEFQRADCAPMTIGELQLPTYGDGILSVADWVQVARFAAGIDTAAIAGGPVSNLSAYVLSSQLIKTPASVTENEAKFEVAPALASSTAKRTLAVIAPKVCYSDTVNTYQIRLKSVTGTENAASFSLAIDPTVQVFRGARLSSENSGGLLVVNDRLADSGKLGFVIALPSGKSFGTGSPPLIDIDFYLKPPQKRSAARLSFANAPARISVASITAVPLAVGWQDMGDPTITPPPPSLAINTYMNGQIVRTNRILLSGTASDSGLGNSGITAVLVNGARASNGACAGNEIAHWNGTVRLLEGTNTIRVIAIDGEGMRSTNTLCLISDTLAPKVAITSPQAKARLTNQTVCLKGTTVDSGKTVGVWYRLNEGNWTQSATANAWANWTANLNLQYGSNLLSVYALDSVGNQSKIQTVSFSYIATGRLSIRTNGSGRIDRNFRGDVLEFAKVYRLQAIPSSKSWMFYNWTGSATGFSPVLDFIMAPNAEYTANFVTNDYLAYQGEYDGLFYETNELRNASSGAFRINISDRGTFSGQLRMSGMNPNFSGQFDGTGRACTKIQIKGKSPLFLDWSLSPEGVVGTVTASNWTATAVGYKVIFPPSTSRYTFAISVMESNGWATAQMDAKGSTTVSGCLPNGTLFSSGTKLVQGARWPLYVPLPNGAVLGWLEAENADQKLNWLNAAQETGPSAARQP